MIRLRCCVIPTKLKRSLHIHFSLEVAMSRVPSPQRAAQVVDGITREWLREGRTAICERSGDMTSDMSDLLHRINRYRAEFGLEPLHDDMSVRLD